MTTKTRYYYKSSMKDGEFSSDMRNADNYYDEVRPSWHSNELIKITHAAIYCGWLVGKGYLEKADLIEQGIY